MASYSSPKSLTNHETTKPSELEPLLPKWQQEPRKFSAKMVSLLILGAWVVSIVMQGEASQALQATLQFNKPFFLSCFNHTATAVLLPLIVFYDKCFGTSNHQSTRFDFYSILERYTIIPLDKLIRISLVLSAYYCIQDYFFFAALTNVSVAAANCIFNCVPLFVYCLSICFLHERVAMVKVLSMLVTFVGVTMVVIFQNQDSFDLSNLSSVDSTSFFPGLVMLLSAGLYAGYIVGLSVVVGGDVTDTATLLTLAGLIGTLTIPWWILGSLLLSVSPFPVIYEPLGFPTSSEGLLMLFAVGVSSLTLNTCLPLAICWTSPLETSVGYMLTTPLAGIVDTVVHHTKFSWECIVGSVLVMTGFGMFEYASSSSQAQNVAPKRSENVA